MNASSIFTNPPTLPQCGSEQDQPNTVTHPASCQKKTRSETSARHTWSKDDNKQLMKLYYQSNPSRSGYRRRLHSFWMDADLFPRTEQQLADQARSIRVNNLLSDIELLEIQGGLPQIESIPPCQELQVNQSHQSGEEHHPSVSQAIRNIRNAQPPAPASSRSRQMDQPAFNPEDIESITQQLKDLIANPSSIQS